MRQPGFAGLQQYWLTPWFYRVRFGRWDEIVGVPNPAPDLPYVTAIWHYAQGMAAVRQKRLDDADQHLEALAKGAADPVLDTLTMWDRYPLTHAARIAERTLTAELATACWTSSLVGQMSRKYTCVPSFEVPTGSFSRSTSTRPAMA